MAFDLWFLDSLPESAHIRLRKRRRSRFLLNAKTRSRREAHRVYFEIEAGSAPHGGECGVKHCVGVSAQHE